MAYHFIAISSYYDGGKRIGWHYSSNDPLDKEIIRLFLDRSKEVLGSLDFGIHRLITNDLDWKSVIKKDSFFEDVMIVEDTEKFLELLVSDKKLSARDIAKFFLTVGSISNLKLQKLVYFAYATFLAKTGKKLFNDPIVAYKYGPVVEDVYQLYKSYGRDAIKEDDDTEFHLQEISVPTSFAKLYLSDDSKEVIESLLETIKLYWTKSPSELVEISHVEGGPWSKVYLEGLNCEITDSLILENHHKEL